jgi:lipopolysaccharide/colanic/teichoic acid biosynthesis glycosyltransferase
MLNWKSIFGRLTASSACPLTSYALLPVNWMRVIIDRERMRCDRCKTTFSLITLHITPAHLPQISRIAREIRQRLRQTDDMGYLSPSRIGLVLPDTVAEGAWKVAGDLCEFAFSGTPNPVCQVYVYSGDRSEGECELPTEEAEPKETHIAQAMEVLFVQPLPFWKRALDVVGALTALALAAPVMLLAALAIKTTSRGPVLFTQQRDSTSGRPFTIYKFRTMCVDAEEQKAELRSLNEQDGPAFKIVNDPRVTGVGRFLRKTSIDELPQLFNVLLGDMSLVGPRPLPVDESQRCEAWQRRRLDVTPGLTCIWQVRGRSQVTFSEWARMDVQYIRSRSLLADLALLVKTIPAVLFRRGAC